MFGSAAGWVRDTHSRSVVKGLRLRASVGTEGVGAKRGCQDLVPLEYGGETGAGTEGEEAGTATSWLRLRLSWGGEGAEQKGGGGGEAARAVTTSLSSGP